MRMGHVVARRGITKGGCLIFVLVVSAIAYVGVHAGEVYFRYYKFKGAMEEELRYRSLLPDDRIKANLMAIADSLKLPADAGVVTVTRKDGQITVESQYADTIALPYFKKEVRFAPKVTGG